MTASPTTTVLIPTTGGGSVERIVGVYLDDPAASEIFVILDNPACDAAALEASLPRDPRLRILRNETQLGLTRSLNKAIEAASGDVMIRNDDDDLPEPGRARDIVAFFAAHPACDLMFSHARGVDVPTGRSWTIGGPTEDAAIKAALARRNFIVHSSLAFRKASTARIGHYDPTFRYAQDYDLYLRSMRAGLVFGALPKMLVTRTYHASSITVSKRRRQILFSMSARLIHHAESDDTVRPWRTIADYLKLLLIPAWLRTARRRAGRGR